MSLKVQFAFMLITTLSLGCMIPLEIPPEGLEMDCAIETSSLVSPFSSEMDFGNVPLVTVLFHQE